MTYDSRTRKEILEELAELRQQLDAYRCAVPGRHLLPGGRGQDSIVGPFPLSEAVNRAVAAVHSFLPVGLEGLSGIVRRKRAERELHNAAEEVERMAELVFANARLRNEILERGRAEQALEATTRHLTSILEGIGDAFVSLDLDWRITYVNTLWSQLSATHPEELIGKTYWEQWPNLVGSSSEAEYRRAMTEQVTVYFEQFYEPWDMWFEICVYPFSHGLNIYGRDITEQKRAEEQLQASLREKEVLLKEIHHRVKNNLQVISSLLHLSAAQIQEESILNLLQASQNRIRSMALVHEMLYCSGDLARIDFADYIRCLTEYLCCCYGTDPQAVEFVLNIDDIHLDVNTAIPCSLIVSELVSNILKYAFPQARKGRVRIELSAECGMIVLVVKDDGIGLPRGFEPERAKSLGVRLVIDLAAQLGGHVEFIREHGTTVIVTFPAPA